MPGGVWLLWVLGGHRCVSTAGTRRMGPAIAKWTALGVFVVQNAGVILLMRYSKVHSDSTGSYNSAVAVLMQEATKVMQTE